MKGQVFDILGIVFLVIFLAFSSVMTITILNQVNQTGIATNPTSQAVLNAGLNTLPTMMDWFIPAIMFFLSVAAVVSAHAIRTHPIFFVGAVFTLIVGIWFCSVLAHMYFMMADNSMLAPAAAMLPATNIVVSNLPIIFLIDTVMVSIILYGRRADAV